MSVAVGWDFAPAPARMPSRTARPELRLVRPGERAPVPAIRLARRGRLLITSLVTATALSLAMMLATSVSAIAPEIDHATTVFAGQTLSDVAAAQLPGLPLQDAVAQIQLANGLNTTQVHAGQSLLIPSLP